MRHLLRDRWVLTTAWYHQQRVPVNEERILPVPNHKRVRLAKQPVAAMEASVNLG